MSTRQNLRLIIILLMASGLLMAGGSFSPWAGVANIHAAPVPENGVVIYQFHRRFRCEACHSLEAAINETLKRHFSGELKDGRVIYRVVDLDAEGNSHYEKDYSFFYNTVIMVDVKNGREVRFKNLEKVWDLVGEPEEIIKFVRTHVKEYL